VEQVGVIVAGGSVSTQEVAASGEGLFEAVDNAFTFTDSLVTCGFSGGDVIW